MLLETRRITASLRSAPNLIIIGAQKAGTSSLWLYLKQHPDVSASLKKEIRYFQANYHRGLDWYRGHFPFSASHTSKIVFEASPGYILYPQVPARIYRQYPETKIIVLLRNPIHRAYSHYKMNLRRPNVHETLSFADAIAAEAERLKNEIALINEPGIGYSEIYDQFSYLARGRYQEQLQPWFDVFPAEQIQVIQAEHLFDDTKRVYNEVLQFLNLDAWTPDSFKALNQSGVTDNLRDTIGYDLYEQLHNYFAPYNEQLCQQLNRVFDWT